MCASRSAGAAGGVRSRRRRPRAPARPRARTGPDPHQKDRFREMVSTAVAATFAVSTGGSRWASPIRDRTAYGGAGSPVGVRPRPPQGRADAVLTGVNCWRGELSANAAPARVAGTTVNPWLPVPCAWSGRRPRDGHRGTQGHADAAVRGPRRSGGEAVGAEKALPVIAELQPDIVLCDVRMQGASGLDLCREIRERDPGLQ